MVIESKKKANARYDKAHTKGVYLKLNQKTDSDILEKLASVPNTQGYIKQLIRQDIAGSVPVPVSVSESFKDPFSDTIAKAIGTWNDIAVSILSDNTTEEA